MSRFYITTPIYYVNDAPHLGHAYATIAADALSRFHRARGDDAYFLTGTDEHGQKIEAAAAARGKQPLQLADEVVERFRATWRNLDIANDDFIRTTEDRHKRVVTEVWRRIEAAGDIYLGSYDGWYCVACEAFYPESQLVDGRRCPTHETEASWVSEPSFFFRMSKYQQPLLDHIAANPGFVRPDNYRNEVVSFVSGGLRDLSVSRTSFKWGIPVPGHPDHVIYVWIDALTNYMSALGEPGSALYQRYWPATCHLIGKDILRFHAVYWPCMLLSAGLPLPETVFTTGWWTLRGAKISKSMPATHVEPNRLAEDIGADALRYFLLREVPLGGDGDFSYEALIARYNADLANDLGNLCSRTLGMTAKFCGGAVPAASDEVAAREPHAELARVAAEVAREAAACFEDYAPSRALEAIWRLVRQANRYIDACQPWALARDAGRRAELDHCMHVALAAVAWAARMAAPVIPRKAAQILAQLGYEEEAAAEALARWPDPDAFAGSAPVGQRVAAGAPLFPRIDDARAAELIARWTPAQAAGAATPPAAGAAGKAEKPAGDGGGGGDRVSFDEFSRLDLRVGEILSAESIPKTKKLLRLTVDLGGETRQIVAGLAERFAPDDLRGRKVIVVANLQPATIRGVRSEGMVLAAGDAEILGLSAIDADVPAGTRVR